MRKFVINVNGKSYDVEVEEKPVNSTTQAEYSYYKLDPEATEKAGGVPQFSDSPTTITVDRTESATALAIKSITPNGSYGGGIGVNTSAPKSSTAKANNSGKGGKTKEPQKKQTKKASDEVERYHEVNDAIDDLDESMKDLNREFEKLSTRTDRAFGASKIKLMRQQREELRKQVDVIDDQIEAQKRLLAEEKKYLQQDKSEAQSYGWTFDGNGNVQNYESTLQKIVDEYNAVILAYNAMDAAAQEAYMKAKDEEGRDPLQQAEDRYNEVIEALNKYEETREKIEDTENDIADKEKERLEKLQEEYDLLLAEVQTEIELKVSVDDSALDLLKDKLADLGDSADNALDVIANINEQVDIEKVFMIL